MLYSLGVFEGGPDWAALYIESSRKSIYTVAVLSIIYTLYATSSKYMKSILKCQIASQIHIVCGLSSIQTLCMSESVCCVMFNQWTNWN